MGSHTATFTRTEKKYRLSAGQVQELSALLAPYIEIDQFGATRIDSLYFDTPDRALIARSLEKPLYKEKLRVRSYGSLAQAQEVFVEIKKKFKGVVYKRRVKMSREGAAAWLLRGVPYEQAQRAFPLAQPASVLDDRAVRAAWAVAALEAGAALHACAPVCQKPLGLDAVSLQIAREIEALRARYQGLRPSMLITCNRSAYQVRRYISGEVRVTFDAGVAFVDVARMDAAPNLQDGPFTGGLGESAATCSESQFGKHARAASCTQASEEGTTPLLLPGEQILELKTASACPLWLVRALSAVEAKPSSFSKYGTAYQRVRALNERKYCA